MPMVRRNIPVDCTALFGLLVRVRRGAGAVLTCGVLVVGCLVVFSDSARAGGKKKKLSYKQMREVVMSAPREKLRAIGAHIVVGYDVAFQLTPFLERGAIGGVYLTKRNSRKRTVAQLAKEVEGFRQLANGNTERPLWITADQEGGLVSRLSPPLPRQGSLRTVVHAESSPLLRDKAVRAFARADAHALSSVGVNINFAPVVDLSPIRRMRRDRYTRLEKRAISRDPGVVTLAAAAYCETLARFDLMCTLKHFPGLSRVNVDTHLADAKLTSARDDVEGQDWVPFREVMEAAPAALMVGHPRVKVLDPMNPASTSKKVISGLVRDEWNFEGLVITDDLDMGAITRRKGGMAKAGIDALNAGADLILFTFDATRIVPVFYALLEAYDDGRLDRDALARSRVRLDAVARQMRTRGTSYQEARDYEGEQASSH